MSGRIIDGKPVRKFLFARETRTVLPGFRAMIPVDRRERSKVLDADERRFLALVQVEGFNLDHALNRLTNEIFPGIARRDWNFISELDAEHEVGQIGATFPLIPAIATPRRIQ